MRARWVATARALGLGLMLASLGARAGPQVYGESFMVKVRPQTPPHDPSPVRLLAARNESVSFQVVIHGGDTGATAVRASLEGLEGPSHLGGSQITLYREDFLDVTHPSGGTTEPGRWPDALIPDVDEIAGEPRQAFPFDVPPQEARALWVDVLVPEDAPAGHYVGSVTVTGSAGLSASVPVSLTVVDAVLPSTPSYTTAFSINPDRVCEAHTGRADCGSDAVRVELLTRYAWLALDHRLTLSNVFILQPLDGAWDAFDATYAPLLDGTAPTRLPGARMTSAQYMGPLDGPSLSDFVTHFSEHGWLSRAFDYTADEPPLFSTYDDVRARATLVEHSAPGLVRMVTTSLANAQAQHVDGLIDRMSVLIQVMAGTEPVEVGPQRSTYDAFLAQPGRSLWLYQSCSSHACRGTLPDTMHWPSYMVDHPAPLNRAMPWLVFLEQASGESYYETAAQLPTAWTDQEFYGGNGDGTLFYPGTPERIGGQTQVPLPSLRLKLLRAGVQDYEWLTRVAQGGDPAFAEQVARELVPLPYQVSLDAQAFEHAREQLILRALELPSPDYQQHAVPPGDVRTRGCGCGGPASQDSRPLVSTLGLVWLLWRCRRRSAQQRRP